MSVSVQKRVIESRHKIDKSNVKQVCDELMNKAKERNKQTLKTTPLPTRNVRRTKPCPKGTLNQMDYCIHRVMDDPEKPNRQAPHPPSEPRVKLVKQSGHAQVPHDTFEIPLTTLSCPDENFPTVLPSKPDEDQTVDKLIGALDKLDVTDSEDEETGELKKTLQKYKNEAPAWQLNRYQLRKAFKAAYDAKFGIRASLADCRIGAYLQRLAKKYYHAQRINQKWNEATFRVFLENTSSDTCFESFYSEPGLCEGPRLKWDKVGSVYPIFALDGFGFYYICELRLWVEINSKDQK